LSGESLPTLLVVCDALGGVGSWRLRRGQETRAEGGVCGGVGDPHRARP